MTERSQVTRSKERTGSTQGPCGRAARGRLFIAGALFAAAGAVAWLQTRHEIVSLATLAARIASPVIRPSPSGATNGGSSFTLTLTPAEIAGRLYEQTFAGHAVYLEIPEPVPVPNDIAADIRRIITGTQVRQTRSRSPFSILQTPAPRERPGVEFLLGPQGAEPSSEPARFVKFRSEQLRSAIDGAFRRLPFRLTVAPVGGPIELPSEGSVERLDELLAFASLEPDVPDGGEVSFQILRISEDLDETLSFSFDWFDELPRLRFALRSRSVGGMTRVTKPDTGDRASVEDMETLKHIAERTNATTLSAAACAERRPPEPASENPPRTVRMIGASDLGVWFDSSAHGCRFIDNPEIFTFLEDLFVKLSSNETASG